MEENRHDSVYHYLETHFRGVLAFLLMCGAAAVIFALYRLPVAAVGYAAVICGFIGLVFLVLDYRKFAVKCRRLEELKTEILTTTDTLPESRNEVEQAYQELLCILYGEKERLCTEQEQKYRELVDYYSVWAHQIKTPIAAARLILQSAERRNLEILSGNPEWPVGNESPEQPGKNGNAEQPVGNESPEQPGKNGNAEQPVGNEGPERPGKNENPEDAGYESQSLADIRELKEELRRIGQYAEMVLCYLRLDSNSTDYVIREYDLDAIVRQAVRKHASVFIRKKLKLVYEPLQARVVTDEKWLLFVVEQVLSNALKYTPCGSVTITLEQPKTLCIRDTGIGIAPEDLPRIFEKGYTGQNGRADKKASGIGLYLCRRICRNLGHEILAVSGPGTGTEIRIDLKNAELEIE